MIRAIVLISLFVATIGTLMLVGWRHRPVLEVPPRFTPEPSPELRKAVAVQMVVLWTIYAAYFVRRALGVHGMAKILFIAVAAFLAVGAFVLVRRLRRAPRESR